MSSTHPTAAALRSACNSGVGRSEVRSDLSAYSGVREDEHQIRQAELAITFVVAEPHPVTPALRGRRTIFALAVSSGLATADALAATALAYLDAGQTLVGVFLANPDPSDQTIGGIVSEP